MSSPVGYPQRNAYPMFSSTSQGDVPVGKDGANLIPVTANVTSSSGGVGTAWDLSPPSAAGHVVFSALPRLNYHLPADGRVYSRTAYPSLAQRLGRIANGFGTFAIRPTVVDNNWRSICWSPELGIYVAVGDTGTGNRVMTSPDGLNWTAQTAPDNDWRSVCWAASVGLFVAVGISGTGNRVMTSPDGVAWTLRSSPADNAWVSVCWSPELSLFVAVSATGVSNRVMTSPNGVTWSIRTTPVDNAWRGVCWSASRALFVAVADTGTGNRVMTSPDGLNWAVRTSAADNGWQSVCWSHELAQFAAVANTGTSNRVMTAYGCTYNPITDFAVPKITPPAGCYAHILAG